MHHANVLADPAAPHSHPTPQPRPADAPPPVCENPCHRVPYLPGEPAEADIITGFQTLERAVTRNDADEWVKHMADEFVVYRTGQNPTPGHRGPRCCATAAPSTPRRSWRRSTRCGSGCSAMPR